MTPHAPGLERAVECGLTIWRDRSLADAGVVVAFTERSGGVSEPPYASLNLAAHVGDDPRAVDENRARMLGALDLARLRERLTSAEQVHGDGTAVVESGLVGSGAFAAGATPPVQAVDALITSMREVPLMLCFADCVPIVLVAPGPAVGIVHAGWRGALVSLPGKAVSDLAQHARCTPLEVRAYIGAHICAEEYAVDAHILSQFTNAFGTVARADSGCLDLDAVVTASLERAGVASCNIARLGACTSEAHDRFFSYRAEGGKTGRHAALACIL